MVLGLIFVTYENAFTSVNKTHTHSKPLLVREGKNQKSIELCLPALLIRSEIVKFPDEVLGGTAAIQVKRRC